MHTNTPYKYLDFIEDEIVIKKKKKKKKKTPKRTKWQDHLKKLIPKL